MSRRATPSADELMRLLGALLRLRTGSANRLPGFAEPILVFLGTRPEAAVRMGELRERLGLGQSRASRLCAALKRAGLVQITTAEDDRRASWVQLTPAGRELVEESASALRADLYPGS
jgi:DNA-binding transcriptional ArsR family regulator